MVWPDGRTLTLHDGVVSEPATADGRVVLWLPGEPIEGERSWERVGNVPHAAVTTEQGICSTTATAVRTRRVAGSPLTRLLRRFGRSTSGRTWTLPDGTTVEQWGPRRADLRLAWAEDETCPLDEARVRAVWPECWEVRAVGRNLLLVSGLDLERPASSSGSAPAAAVPESTVLRAERLLAVARASADPRRDAIALADLGLAFLEEGNPQRARDGLEEALAAARRVGDPAREADVLLGLGQALIALGEHGSARQMLDRALSLARSLGDRYTEKAVLEHLGFVQVAFADHAGALATFEQALALAVELRDSQHVVNLLWLAAIQNAELGDRDRAIAFGQQAVDLLRRLAKPQANWYAWHLALYHASAPGATLAAPPDTFLTSVVASTARPEAPAPPGLLRMARTATEAMFKFVGSGFKTTDDATYRGRLQVCSTCEHHTGLRCRICGCFTAAKAKLFHEACPAGRWPN